MNFVVYSSCYRICDTIFTTSSSIWDKREIVQNIIIWFAICNMQKKWKKWFHIIFKTFTVALSYHKSTCKLQLFFFPSVFRNSKNCINLLFTMKLRTISVIRKTAKVSIWLFYNWYWNIGNIHKKQNKNK